MDSFENYGKLRPKYSDPTKITHSKLSIVIRCLSKLRIPILDNDELKSRVKVISPRHLGSMHPSLRVVLVIYRACGGRACGVRARGERA